MADEVVDATLPFLNRHVRGLVEFQRLTGCRPGEACALRWCDLDTSAAVWVFAEAAAAFDRSLAHSVTPAERLDGLSFRAGAYAQSGRTEDALRDAGELEKDPSAVAAYNRTCILGQVAASSGIDTGKRESLVRDAMAALRTAVARGYTNLQDIAADDDLQVLRDRDDYLALLKEMGAKDPPGLRAALLVTGRRLLDRGSAVPAERAVREALPLFEAKPADAAGLAELRLLLGRSLAAQKRYADAEKELLAAFGPDPNAAADTPVRKEAAGRLAELYTAWGKPEQAKSWEGKVSKGPGKSP